MPELLSSGSVQARPVLRPLSLRFQGAPDKLNLRAWPVHHALGNHPARNPKSLNTLSGLWAPDRSAQIDPRQVPLNGHDGNGGPPIGGDHPVAVYPFYNSLVRFGRQVSKAYVIDIAVPNRTIVGDHPVADDRRGPVIVDNGGPVDIRDPDAGVTVHAVKAATGNDNRMAGVSQPADADWNSASFYSNDVAPRSPIVMGVVRFGGRERDPADIGGRVYPGDSSGIPAY